MFYSILYLYIPNHCGIWMLFSSALSNLANICHLRFVISFFLSQLQPSLLPSHSCPAAQLSKYAAEFSRVGPTLGGNCTGRVINE